MKKRFLNLPECLSGLEAKTWKRRLVPLAAGMLLLSSFPALAAGRWQSAEGEKYYIKEDGSRYENTWFSIESVPANPLAKVTVTWYYAGPDGAVLTNGWHEIEGKHYYFYPGGNSPRNAFFNLDGKRYYVDETGARAEKGWFSVTTVNSSAGVSSVSWYYANPDGSLRTGGWQVIDGVEYYFDANGRSPRNNWVNVEDARYHVDERGGKQTGWFSVSGVNGNGQAYENWYYAEPDGKLARNGWKDLEGHRYYLDANGLSYRKRWYVDGDKNRYYLDEGGILQQNGWFRITNTSASTGVTTENWYWADAAGSVKKDGVYEIDGAMYRFDANGTMYKKRWYTDEKGKKQYFGENGAMCRNQWFSISGERADGSEYTNWYYADENGLILTNGWKTVDGKDYYFNTGGNISTGWLDDDKYYCGDDGARRYGWSWIELDYDWIDDNDNVRRYADQNGDWGWFYFSPESGRKRESGSGFEESRVDGITYCFDTYGIMQMGWVKMRGASPALSGYRYYSPSAGLEGLRQGQKAKDCWLKTELPEDIDGASGEKWRYFQGNGAPVCAPAGGYVIQKIDGKKYAFDDRGAARTGLLEIDGEVYYFGEPDGDYAMVTGACELTDDTGEKADYYFEASGKGATGIKNGRFYYKGRLQTADRHAKYEVFRVPGKGLRLIDSNGKVVKGRKVTDGDKCRWKVNSSGTIEEFGSDYVAEITEPETVPYEG